MGTLSRCDSMDRFQLSQPNFVSECSYDHRFPDVPGILEGSSRHPTDANSCDDEAPVECDYFGGVFDYIKQMLMEEDDLEHRPCMFQDCSALQAAEKYFYDALSDKDYASLEASVNNRSPDEIRSISGFVQISGEGLWTGDSSRSLCDFDEFVDSGCWVQNSSSFNASQRICDQSFGMENNGDFPFLIDSCLKGDIGPKEKIVEVIVEEGRDGEVNSTNDNSYRKKNHNRGDDDDCAQGRSGKQIASYAEEPEQTEKYDKALLCPKMNPGFYNESPACHCEETLDKEVESQRLFRKSTEVKRGRPKGSKNHRKIREVIDFRNLLTRCAEAVSSFNTPVSEEILKQIRQHCSPYGDANERLAHCFGNALEARMAGTGSTMYTSFASRRIPAAELLKSYRTYVTSCPFLRMSNIFANKSIGRHVREATRIHIIDFGILYGFQWPCFIQGVSLRPGGAPLLKITGIDWPQPGFKPAERVEKTGHRLMNYCKRFNVPFEFNAIAKKWDDICLEDLKVERDETVVVNCLYRLDHASDETSGVNSSRDSVLKLIKKINPHLFVHGVINGTYNAPFFTTRFREALRHYSSLFDMLEGTIPHEDQDRLMYEREVFGREVMNIIACEGSERIERPETYKQWQVRNLRAGFRQLPLNREILKEVKTKVGKDYHSYFLLDEDSEWLLQGWKGRVMYGLSCWKPLQE